MSKSSMTNSRCDSDYSRQALSTNSICSIKSYTEIPLCENTQKSHPKLKRDIRTSLLPLNVIVHPRPPINYTVIKKDYRTSICRHKSVAPLRNFCVLSYVDELFSLSKEASMCYIGSCWFWSCWIASKVVVILNAFSMDCLWLKLMFIWTLFDVISSTTVCVLVEYGMRKCSQMGSQGLELRKKPKSQLRNPEMQRQQRNS